MRLGLVSVMVIALVLVAAPGASPGNLGFQGVWVAVENAQKVVKVDIRDRKVVRSWSVPGRPHNIVANHNDTVATALWTSGDRVAVIHDGRMRTTSLGGAPHDVKMGGGRIVVANQGAARLELMSLKGELRRRVPLKANPHDLTLTGDNRKAWVTLEGSDDMALVNLSRARVARYVSTGRRPHDLLVSFDNKLWVSDWHGAVHVFSAKGRRLETITVGEEAHHLAFSPNRPEVWITDHGTHRIYVIDTRTYKMLARIPIKGAPHHVAFTTNGRWAAVADHDNGIVVIYKVRTRKRIGKVVVGSGPHGVWQVN